MENLSRDVWFTVKVGQRQATRKFTAKWSWKLEDYVVPQTAFQKVASELGAGENEEFNIFNPLN